MSFTNVVVGEPNYSKSISTIVYYKRAEKEIQRHVSSNSELFWVKTNFIDFSFKIMKSCDEGRQLSNLLGNEEIPAQEILDYIDSVALQHIPLSILKQKILNKEKEAYENGKRDTQKEIRKALGI